MPLCFYSFWDMALRYPFPPLCLMTFYIFFRSTSTQTPSQRLSGNRELHDTPYSTSVQLLSCVRLFAAPWTAAPQASLSITNSHSPLKPMSIELVMPSNHLILCHPLLLLPQSLPASESFPMSQLFPWGGQSTGVSALASFFQRNPRADLLQNRLVGSPCSPRDSQESSPALQFKSINSSALRETQIHAPMVN